MLGAALTMRFFFAGWALAATPVPHNQDRAPGPALSPSQAVPKMRLPQGFHASVFAAEPNLVNPVAMTFDDRGRVWVTESLEYPRLSAGPGKDCVKILQDTNGDGKADKFTIFADGLNIPSGIALGHGGAFVVNAPDLLFLKDSDGDDRADSREVLLTGFGRHDVHELPNNLTWGPDGWLYGLNGVFNHSVVEHQGKRRSFTCALFRYHPRTRAFELYCEGTSNPWGLDYDRRGNFFVSACVIDHLWHLTETGYYHRQAGAYPPGVWKIESIVQHQHQKAAYCGLCFYDADLFPQDYRGRLFMGNIHGACINSDSVERQGASYFAKPNVDFLSADDAWFMPVAQKVGLDGAMWVLDWYDRYHCYQDARRDPPGIDRAKGRLYRITYGNDRPNLPPPIVSKLTDDKLIELLGSPNNLIRRQARQILVERSKGSEKLERLALQGATPANVEALWTLISQGPMRPAFHREILTSRDATLRDWGVRAAGLHPPTDSELTTAVLQMAHDPDPAVRLQTAIAARKIQGNSSIPVLLEVLSKAHDDPSELTAKIVWMNLEPLLADDLAATMHWIGERPIERFPAVASLAGRIVEHLLAGRHGGPSAARPIVEQALMKVRTNPVLAVRALDSLFESAVAGRWSNDKLKEFAPVVERAAKHFEFHSPRDPGFTSSLGLAVLQGNKAAVQRAVLLVGEPSTPNDCRIKLLRALVQAAPDAALQTGPAIFQSKGTLDESFLLDALSTLGRLDRPQVGGLVVASFSRMPPTVRPQALDLMTSRVEWGLELVAAVEKGEISTRALNVNQLRRLVGFRHQDLTARVEKQWGRVRTGRDKNREQIIARMRRITSDGHVDVGNGKKVFQKTCAQCHKLHGEGQEVGPDLTNNGRSSLEQILANLLDPNQVIGKDYQARIVATADGRLITGLVVEDSPDRVVLKVAGGKQETFPRSDVETIRVSEISLMPEELEKQISEQEFRDLIGYLLRDPTPAKN